MPSIISSVRSFFNRPSPSLSPVSGKENRPPKNVGGQSALAFGTKPAATEYFLAPSVAQVLPKDLSEWVGRLFREDTQGLFQNTIPNQYVGRYEQAVELADGLSKSYDDGNGTMTMESALESLQKIYSYLPPHGKEAFAEGIQIQRMPNSETYNFICLEGAFVLSGIPAGDQKEMEFSLTRIGYFKPQPGPGPTGELFVVKEFYPHLQSLPPVPLQMDLF